MKEAGEGEVRIVVVSHDSGDCLRACVATVLAQPEATELRVVDNASTDGALDALPRDPRLIVLRNSENRGFAFACNQGAADARSEYLLFLNPDCELPAGALFELLRIVRARPRLGLLGAQLLNEDGTPQAASRRRTPTPARALVGLLGGRVAVELRAPAPGEAAADCELIDAVSGALMLLPRALFERLGGFDPGYTLHCEDLDLCRRVRQAGLDVAISGQVRVPHRKGTSSRRRPFWVEWQKHRGMRRYFRKFDAALSPWWLRAMVPLGIGLHLLLAWAFVLARRVRAWNSCVGARS